MDRIVHLAGRIDACAAMLDEPDAEYCKKIADDLRTRAENGRLRAALQEIAGDPTGVSSFQADLAKQALDGTYEPFSDMRNAVTSGEPRPANAGKGTCR